ncbi:MAG: AbrB/MazE/SpoVT family DNA-binding domain-containing protein [Dehalococcoidia bacterium]
MHIVGPKGQIVIEKELRDRLGIGPGWVSLQCVIDDHLEVRFLPPEHEDSLKGMLAPLAKRRVAPGEDWDRARERAARVAAQERTGVRNQADDGG